MHQAQAAGKTDEALARIKALIRQFLDYEPAALRTLLACVLAVTSTALAPPFLSLTSGEVQAFLRETESIAPLIVAVEYLVLGVITLIGGATGDVFGHRRLLLFGLILLLLAASAGIFTVGTPAHLNVQRLILLAGLFALPMSVAIVTLVFEPAMRPFAFGMLFGARSVALLIAAVTKHFAEQIGSPWLAFLPAIALGAVSLWLVMRYAPPRDAHGGVSRTVAFLNLALLAIAFLIAFFILGSVTVLQNSLLALIIVGTLIIVAATIRWLVRRYRYFENWELFTGRDVILAIIVGMLISGVQGAFIHEFWSFNSGALNVGWFVNSLRVAPYVLGVLAGSFSIVRIAQRFGARQSIAGGMLLMAVSLLLMALIGPNASYWLKLAPIFLMGLGFGIATPVRAQVILSAPPRSLVGASAAMNSATGQLGLALGIAASSIIVMRLADNSFLSELKELGVSQSDLVLVEQALSNTSMRAAQTTYDALPQVVAQISSLDYATAWADGLTQLFLSFGIAMLIGSVAVYLIMSRQLPAVSMPAPAAAAPVAAPAADQPLP